MSDQAYSPNFSNGEEFEKVDPDFVEQDENVTSSSMPADMAEEDRYNTDQDLLGDFGGGSMAASEKSSDLTPQGQPLINFGDGDASPESSVTESTPSKPAPMEAKKEVAPASEGGLMGLPGMESMCCWMKNVDPRDEEAPMSEPAVTTMEEQAAPTATSPVSAAPGAKPAGGEVIGGHVRSETDTLDVEKDIDSSDEYSEDESSGSTFDSESDNSDMESSENEGTYDMDPSEQASVLPEQAVDLDTNMDVASPEYERMSGDSRNVQETELDNSERQSSETESSAFVEQSCEMVSDLEDEVMPESTSQNVFANQAEPDSGNLSDDSSSSNNPDQGDMNALKVQETYDMSPELNTTSGACSSDTDLVQKTNLDNDLVQYLIQNSDDTDVVKESDLHESYAKDEGLATDESDQVDVQGGSIQVIEEGKVSEYKPMGLSEEEMSDLLDRLTSEQDECLETVEKDEYLDKIESPVFEQECQTVLESVSSGGNSSDDESGDSSEKEEEDSSIDSDISGDEPVFGVWNPSPLHSDNLELMTEEDMEDDTTSGMSVLSGYKYLEAADESNSSNGQESYTELFEESLLNPSTQPSILTVRGDHERVEKSRDSSVEMDQCHVKFQNPTNTIFYDPESPVVDRVSVQVSDDLRDYDDEAKDVEKEKEQVVPENPDDFEYMDEDPSEFSLYPSKRKEEQDGELEGAMQLIKDTGLEELTLLATQMKTAGRKKAQTDKYAGSKTKIIADNVQDEDLSEVVLRRKNDKNVSDEHPEHDRAEVSSMIIHDIEETVEATAENMNMAALALAHETDVSKEEDLLGGQKDALISEVIDKMTSDFDERKEIDNVALENYENQAESDTANRKVNETREQGTGDSDIKTVEEIGNFSMEKIENLASEIADSIINDVAEECADASDENKTASEVDDIEEIDVSATCFNTSLQNTVLEPSFEDDKPQLVEQAMEYVSGDAENNVDKLFSSPDFAGGVYEDIVAQVQDKQLEAVPSDAQQDKVGVEAEDAGYIVEQEDTQAEPIPIDVQAEDATGKAGQTEIRQLEEIQAAVDAKVEDVLNSAEMEEKAAEKAELVDKESFRERAKAMLLRASSEVLELIYWRDVKTTGIVFGSMLLLLLSLSLCSLLSVLAYLSLATLTVTLSFRLYKTVMQAVQKTNEGHPFKKLLDLDIALKEDVVQAAAMKIADNINNCATELRRLYLVGDYVDSLKFGLLLWLMTYVGAWFNGMTLVILVVVSIFTLPKVYETYQGPIDQNVNLVRAQLNNIMAQVSAKIPFPKKKAKTQ